jgi:hypothetical protein
MVMKRMMMMACLLSARLVPFFHVHLANISIPWLYASASISAGFDE